MDEALSVGWELEEVGKKLQRTPLSRVDFLYRHLAGECIAGCQGQWLLMAKEVLQQNNIRQVDFADAIRTLLEKGCGKYRNLYIKGPCICGKTFLLNPLNRVFKIFCNQIYNFCMGWCSGSQGYLFKWLQVVTPYHSLAQFPYATGGGQEVHVPKA